MMKRINRQLIWITVAVMTFTAGCAELDLEPEGATFTEEQWSRLVETSPERLTTSVNGLYSGLMIVESITSWYGAKRHYDYGYASACMMFDASGVDVSSEYDGYNWYRNTMGHLDRTATSDIGYFLWNLFYGHLKTANDILAVVPADATDATLKTYRGQALASRAFDYLHLVQMYQFTYKGHESAPAVPIVTENTTGEESANNPRATVQQVYDLIMNDLNEAVMLLEGFTRANKGVINQNVAYGLRARANLLMQNWAAAAADAEKAMAGYTPYSIADVSGPSFNNIAASSWIWGSIVSETGNLVRSGILNFPSMMSSFTGNGYAPGYAGRYINSALYGRIPDTDVRKHWWALADPVLDEDGEIAYYDFVDTEKRNPYVDWEWTYPYQGNEYNIAEWLGWQAPYLNIKFGAYQGVYNNPTNACDLPLMRAEEMLLIKAEGLAMSGDVVGGKAALEGFIKAYRDPSYTCPAADAAAMQDEVWFQRRVELWGEGFSLFDVLRLKKAVTRKGTNYPNEVAYDLKAEDPIYLWIIPRDEMNANSGITDDTNNPIIAVPKP